MEVHGALEKSLINKISCEFHRVDIRVSIFYNYNSITIWTSSWRLWECLGYNSQNVQLQVYDKSGCVKLSALDAINSLLVVNGLDTNDTIPGFKAKNVEGDKSSKCKMDCSFAKGLLERKMSSSEPAKVSPLKKATSSLSSSKDEQDGESSVVARSEKLRLSGQRGRPKKSKDFFEDVEEKDFGLFHKPWTCNNSKQSAAEDTREAVKRMSIAKKKPQKKAFLVLPPRARGFKTNDKIGHGYLQCPFLIDGSLEDLVHVVEASWLQSRDIPRFSRFVSSPISPCISMSLYYSIIEESFSCSVCRRSTEPHI